MKVLVTGGAGFIGSHIVERLLEKNYEVGVLDNFYTGEMSNISHVFSKISLYKEDITNFEQVSRIVKRYEAVIHEAALVSVTRSIEDPRLVNAVNITGTLNLLKASVDSKIRKFVYASSSSVYGETPTLPKVETMNTVPVSPYGNTKLAAENYCSVFAKVYGLPTVSLRYFNVYGPKQKPGPYSGVIPTFINLALSGKPPVIFGDGKQTRDFTFVKDTAEANILALEKEVPPGEVLNVAMGGTISVNELAEIILEAVGREDIRPVHGPERKGDIRASYADISKAKTMLGYEPSHNIRDGLREVTNWFAREVDR